jgi:3'-phosphoadenosine 5'-phosphosulfate sulfotransferase (PAPS reductase)/FAD synthetase
MSSYTGIQKKSEEVIYFLMDLFYRIHTVSAGVSFGKDRSVVLTLMLETIRRCVEKGTDVNPCLGIHSDTKNESSAMNFYAECRVDAVRVLVEERGLNIETHVVDPDLSVTLTYGKVGRRKWSRLVDNSSKEYSVDWKVEPQQNVLDKIISLLAIDAEVITLVAVRIRTHLCFYNAEHILMTPTIGPKIIVRYKNAEL